MNTNTSEIAFILDRSGSMVSIAESTADSFNSFLATQQKEHEELPDRLTLVLFDTECEVLYSSVPVPEVKCLDQATDRPDGSTPLLDAIGHTIDETGKRLSVMEEKDRPATVIVAILTDGEENSSKMYGHRRIQDMIKLQKYVYNWKFLYLGANQDAIATASSMGIP
jgi:Mg-chelatase subunit ChlD